jgi:hypothetical protein
VISSEKALKMEIAYFSESWFLLACPQALQARRPTSISDVVFVNICVMYFVFRIVRNEDILSLLLFYFALEYNAFTDQA